MKQNELKYKNKLIWYYTETKFLGEKCITFHFYATNSFCSISDFVELIKKKVSKRPTVILSDIRTDSRDNSLVYQYRWFVW